MTGRNESGSKRIWSSSASVSMKTCSISSITPRVDESPPELAQRHAHLVDHPYDVGLGPLAAGQEQLRPTAARLRTAGGLGVAGDLRADLAEQAIALGYCGGVAGSPVTATRRTGASGRSRPARCAGRPPTRPSAGRIRSGAREPWSNRNCSNRARNVGRGRVVGCPQAVEHVVGAGLERCTDDR